MWTRKSTYKLSIDLFGLCCGKKKNTYTWIIFAVWVLANFDISHHKSILISWSQFDLHEMSDTHRKESGRGSFHSSYLKIIKIYNPPTLILTWCLKYAFIMLWMPVNLRCLTVKLLNQRLVKSSRCRVLTWIIWCDFTAMIWK